MTRAHFQQALIAFAQHHSQTTPPPVPFAGVPLPAALEGCFDDESASESDQEAIACDPLTLHGQARFQKKAARRAT